MRILQINQCHYPRGGADVVYLNTIKLLESEGHEVACFSTLHQQNVPSEYDKYFISAPDLRKVSFLKKVGYVKSYLYNSQAAINLSRLIRDFKPDVAQIHLFYASLSVSVLETLKHHNIPVVHTVHDYRLLCPVNSMMDIDKNVCEKCAVGSPINCIKNQCSDGSLLQSTIIAIEAFYWRKIKFPVNYIDHFHFVSNFCRDKHCEYLPQIVDKSSVQYNFSEIEAIETRQGNDSYYLYYGRLSYQKGIMTLVKTWSLLPDTIKLKIVGSGQQLDEIKQYITANSLNNIELLGYKSGNELVRLIQQARFVIVPSEWYENNPMTVIESYHLGVPVIGARIGGIPEIIVDANTGFVFQEKNQADLRDVILKADKTSTKQYNQMSKNCVDFAKTYFSAEISYKYLTKIFEKVIRQKQTNETAI